MNAKRWQEKYPKGVRIHNLKIDESWKGVYEDEEFKKIVKKANKYLTERIQKHPEINYYPYPKNLFCAFNLTPFDKVKVVILGQDPYHGFENGVPQAMGLSFSVYKGTEIPSSLKNIFKNLLKNGHIKEYPSHGNLKSWAKQGCLMLNTALTVREKSPNSHKDLWVPLTDIVIRYISENTNNTAFLLWGANSLEKMKLIDVDKHGVFISSHPSGLSCAKKLRSYDSFNESDNFGNVNEFLAQCGKDKINWNIE